MPRCPLCGKDWPVGLQVCPDDRATLDVSKDEEFTIGAAEDLKPGATIGEFRIDKKVAEGGMATIYAALHPAIGKRAAIKVISPTYGADGETVKRFIQEAR